MDKDTQKATEQLRHSGASQLPNIHHPQGTLDEMRALGIKGNKLKGILTCSSEELGKSAGCKFAETCPFHGIAEVSGPVNISVRRINEDDQAGETLKTCFAYMQVDHMLVEAGQPIEISGIEAGHDTPLNELGHVYLAHGTYKTHEKKDPDCPGCKRGDCALYEDFYEERQIPKFVRPGKMMSGEVGTQKMRERMRRQMGQRVVANRLGVKPNGSGAEAGAAGRQSPRPRAGEKNHPAPSKAAGSEANEG